MGKCVNHGAVLSPQGSPTSGTRSDAELVQAVRSGDKRAFIDLVARHQSIVCGIALGILGDLASSEDAAQEAFVAAWKRMGELRQPERLKGWLCQIARNAALAYRRRQKGEAPLDGRIDLADEAPSPDEVLAKSEEAALVCEALGKLPEIYRLPLVLYYREGQSGRGIALTAWRTTSRTNSRCNCRMNALITPACEKGCYKPSWWRSSRRLWPTYRKSSEPPYCFSGKRRFRTRRSP